MTRASDTYMTRWSGSGLGALATTAGLYALLILKDFEISATHEQKDVSPKLYQQLVTAIRFKQILLKRQLLTGDCNKYMTKVVKGLDWVPWASTAGLYALLILKDSEISATDEKKDVSPKCIRNW